MIFRPGQVVNFAWHNNIFQKAILFRNRLIYGKDAIWTHSGIITRVMKHKVEIYESITKGFTYSWYPKDWLENKIDNGIVAIGTSKKKLTNVHNNAFKYLRFKYAWTDILNILWMFLFGKQATKLTGVKKLICSEAVARILYDSSNKKINFEKEYNKAYDLVEPMDLYLSEQIKW